MVEPHLACKYFVLVEFTFKCPIKATLFIPFSACYLLELHDAIMSYLGVQ